MSARERSLAYSCSTMRTESSKRLVRWRMVLGRWVGIASWYVDAREEDDRCAGNRHFLAGCRSARRVAADRLAVGAPPALDCDTRCNNQEVGVQVRDGMSRVVLTVGPGHT